MGLRKKIHLAVQGSCEICLILFKVKSHAFVSEWKICLEQGAFN